MAQKTVANFREDFTAFASDVTYPDEMVQFWLTVAYQMVRQCQWGSMTDLGAELYTAHNCALEAANNKATKVGAPVGGLVGPANSKSVDKVSVSYDIGSGTVPGWGNWNLTNYGTRFKYYSDLAGMGAVQVDTDPGPIGYNLYGPWG